MTFDEWYEKEWGDNEFNHFYADKEFLEQCWNAATEAAKPRWIPVTESPKYYGQYAAKIDGKVSKFIVDYNNYGWAMNYVTHWMELPK